MTKYTKEERWIESGKMFFLDGDLFKSIIIAPNEETVCLVGVEPDDRQERRIPLIAAAPELLAAVEWLLPYADRGLRDLAGGVTPDEKTYFGSRIAAIRALLALLPKDPEVEKSPEVHDE